MGTQTEHIDWAERNERFAESLDRSDPSGAAWAITAVFYAALHYVDAYFVSHSLGRPANHSQRDSRIGDSADLGAVYPMYRRLKDMSQQARYELARYTEIDYLKALKLLEQVRSHSVLYRKPGA